MGLIRRTGLNDESRKSGNTSMDTRSNSGVFFGTRDYLVMPDVNKTTSG